MKFKRIDLKTLKGLKKAERLKAQLENSNKPFKTLKGFNSIDFYF